MSVRTSLSVWMLLAVLAAPAWAMAAQPVQVQVIRIGNGEPPKVDARLSQALKEQLRIYSQLELIDTQVARLEPRVPSKIKLKGTSAQPLEVTLELVSQSPTEVKLRVRCPALKLESTTTHKDKGVYVVVKLKSKLALAIQPL